MDYIQAEKTIRKMLQTGVAHTCDGTPLSQAEYDALNKALKTLHKVDSKEESEKRKMTTEELIKLDPYKSCYEYGLDKLDLILTEQLDQSDNQVECQTLRWVLDKISELL